MITSFIPNFEHQDIPVDAASSFTFDVEYEHNNEKRWVNVPHDLFLNYLFQKDHALESYCINSKLESTDGAFKFLDSIGFDFEEAMTNYILEFYIWTGTFDELPNYL